MKKLVSLLLVFTLCMSLIACTQNGSTEQTTTQPTENQTQPTEKELTEEEKILAQRRDTVEQYIREMGTVLWKSDVDLEYNLASSGGTLHIRAGRIYQGLPYAFGASTTDSFLEFAGEPDENGIYTISGLESDALGGGESYKNARIGNACSSAVMLAWSQVSDSFTARSSTQFHQKYGVYPVGDYKLEIEGDEIDMTPEVIMANGYEKMYESYAKLQKSDAIIRVNGTSNHSALVTGVEVVYNEDGSINPAKSCIHMLEQARTSQLNQPLNDEITDDVYTLYRIDSAVTFRQAVKNGYIPVTIRELQDPSYIPAEPTITDTETQFNKDTILAGTISCNWMYDTITLTITDETGAEVQKITALTNRYAMKDFVMERFVTDLPATLIGSLDLEALTSGNYHCTVVCRLTNGQEVTARDFDFTV